MKCPHCRATNTEVYNSRATKFSTQVWRRRHCPNCSKNFTTYESPDLSFLKISHSAHGPGRPYSRAELFSSLFAAFHDIPHRSTVIDAVTDTIEAKLLDRRQSRLTTSDITAIVLSTLKHFSTPAFIRYLATHAGLTSPADVTKALRKY